jgi:hypothetical protein
MLGRNVTRRLFVGVVGGGVLAAPVVALSRPDPSAACTPADRGDEPATSENIAKLLHPLVAGAKLARWTIVQIDPLVHGAVRVKVRADDGHMFDVEILARDHAALARPLAETERHAFFVLNGGDGWTATHEEQGLAAMTIAEIVRRNERTTRLSGFLTHGERIRDHGDTMLVERAPGSAHVR